MSTNTLRGRGALRSVALGCAVTLAVACTEPPGTGTFEVVVTSAPLNVGGALVTISGAGISGIEPRSVQFVLTDSSATEMTYLVRGSVGPGDVIARISVDRVDREPLVTILQLAGNQAAGYASMQPGSLAVEVRR